MAFSLSSKSSNPFLMPLLALVAGYIGMKSYVPRMEAANVPKRAQLAQLKTSTQQMAAMDPSAVEALRAQVGQERASVAAKERGIPVVLEAGTLLRQLDAAARHHGLSLSALQPSEANAGVPASAILPYRGASYTVKVTGPWASIVALLADWRAAQPGALPFIRSVRATTGSSHLIADIVFTMVTRVPSAAPASASVPLVPTGAPTTAAASPEAQSGTVETR